MIFHLVSAALVSSGPGSNFVFPFAEKPPLLLHLTTYVLPSLGRFDDWKRENLSWLFSKMKIMAYFSSSGPEECPTRKKANMRVQEKAPAP
jgi:hypothetical protein